VSNVTTRFEVSGTFSVNGDLKASLSCNNAVTGFVLADGRTVRLIVGLEIESKDGAEFTYVTSEQEMRDLGMELDNYDETTFYPEGGAK